MRHQIDAFMVINNVIHIEGWAAPDRIDDKTGFEVFDEAGKPVPVNISRSHRADVSQRVYRTAEAKRLGFLIVSPKRTSLLLRISAYDGDGNITETVEIPFSERRLRTHSRLEKNPLYKGFRYLRRHGFRLFRERAIDKAFHVTSGNYQRWFELHKATPEELEKQRAAVFPYHPLISVVVPLYKTPIPYLRAMIDSVIAQTYSNWQLCLADGSPDDEALQKELRAYEEKDRRIRVLLMDENLGISGNSNAALSLATGEFIALLDHDDELAPDALYEYVALLNEDPECDMIYSDEDKEDETGKFHFDPHFKSDYNPYLFCTCNYICHFFMVRKEIVDRFGGFRSEYDGAQDFDFILRSIENGRKIRHIPKILYYWRSHMNSTAQASGNKGYAYDAGVRAVRDHFARLGENIGVHKHPNAGYYIPEYPVEGHPLVSVLIPNKDAVSCLKRCVGSIYEHATYDRFEIIIIENNSTEPETFAYYNELKASHDNVRIVRYEGEFNYAAINNFGFREAKGEYVLLLNNDTEVITDRIFESMLSFCCRKDVGMVGARLYYDNEYVQHAGVVLGVGGAVAGHAFTGASRGDEGYMARLIMPQNYLAVTAACMMVKSSLYRELGGMDETEFPIEFNDVDLCLRAREKGYLTVYDADVELYHSESATRGYDESPEKKARFEAAVQRLRNRWGKYTEEPDPYYNVNFSRKDALFHIDMIEVDSKAFRLLQRLFLPKKS